MPRSFPLTSLVGETHPQPQYSVIAHFRHCHGDVFVFKAVAHRGDSVKLLIGPFAQKLICKLVIVALVELKKLKYVADGHFGGAVPPAIGQSYVRLFDDVVFIPDLANELLEDILEELVGEIWDEDDVVEEPYIALPDGGWDCTAEMTVSDVFELLELDEGDDDEFTNKLLGEWAYEQFDAIPSVGDSFEYENVAVTVSEMRNNRILRLRVRLTDKGGEGK